MMPYSKNNPPDWAKNLPGHAQEIAIAAFNSSYDEDEDDEKARRIAWAAVKEKYKKVGDKWVPRAALIDISLTITKASLHDDGSMRWAATASDTGKDNLGERTSLALFQDWIERVQTGKGISFLPPPRQPFLGISHYPDLDGYGEAGSTERMYIDGNRFKAVGTFWNDREHPLGAVLFEMVRQEQELLRQRGEAVDRPIRISAAWWDLAHSHGNFIFERKSLDDLCPMCSKGTDDKIYLKGQLDHFAATRVPIHPRTGLTLEEKAMTTKKGDAATIVGEELADELERKSRQLTGKSETENTPELIIKAVTKTVGGKAYPAGDFLVVEDPKSPDTWHLQVKKHGQLDHKLMGGAWAALHEGYRGNKYEGPDKQEAIGKLKKFYAGEKMELPQKAAMDDCPEDDEECRKKHEMTPQGKAAIEAEEMKDRPFGGAMSISEAENFIHAQEMMDKAYSNWGLFQQVMWNILDYSEPGEIKTNMKAAVEEFGNRIETLKAAVSDAFLVQFPGGGIMTQQTQVTAQPVTDILKAAVEALTGAMADPALNRAGKLEKAQAALNQIGEVVKAQIDTATPPDQTEIIAGAVQRGLSPLAEQLGLLLARLGQPTGSGGQGQLPQQKSLSPLIAGPAEQITHSGATDLPVSPATGRPSALTAIIRRSVGIQ